MRKVGDKVLYDGISTDINLVSLDSDGHEIYFITDSYGSRYWITKDHYTTIKNIDRKEKINKLFNV